MDKSTREMMLEIVQGLNLAREAIKLAKSHENIRTWMYMCKVTDVDIERCEVAISTVLDPIYTDGGLAHCEPVGGQGAF